MTDETRDELDRLLDQPEDEDAAVAAFLEAARRELSAPPGEARRGMHLTAIHATARRHARRPVSWWDRVRTVVGLTGVKLGLAAGIAAAVTGAAATGTLPDPVQRGAAEVAQIVGVDLPRPGDVGAGPDDAGRGGSDERGVRRGDRTVPGGERGGPAPGPDRPGRDDAGERPDPPTTQPPAQVPGERPGDAPDRAGGDTPGTDETSTDTTDRRGARTESASPDTGDRGAGDRPAGGGQAPGEASSTTAGTGEDRAATTDDDVVAGPTGDPW